MSRGQTRVNEAQQFVHRRPGARCRPRGRRANHPPRRSEIGLRADESRRGGRDFLSTPLDRKDTYNDSRRRLHRQPRDRRAARVRAHLARHRTASTTLFDTFVEPGGAVAAAHVHPYQTEMLHGHRRARSASRRGREKLELGPGEVVVIDPGRRTSSGTPATRRCASVREVRPALQFESLIETMFGLAADGKTNRKGMPARSGWP